MIPSHVYRELGYGQPSSSSRRPSDYEVREVSPGSERHGSSRRPSYRSVSPMGTSRFERPYVPPSMTPERVAERNAPVGLSSFYSRDPYARREPRRPDLSRYGGERHQSSSRRPSTASQGYNGVDLSSLGGGFSGASYGAMYGSSRHESSSRRPSYGAREMPDFSRDPFGGHDGSYARRGSPAEILGGPFGSGMSSSARSGRHDSDYERGTSSRHGSPHRDYSAYDDLDSAAPRGSHRNAHSSRSHRRY